MIERIVRELSDGEEMVVERVSPTIPEKSGGERIEARRVALGQDDSPREQVSLDDLGDEHAPDGGAHSARPRTRRVDRGPASRQHEPTRERDPPT